MENKSKLPTIEEVRSFSKEQISNLPDWYDHSKIKVGQFAKYFYPKAGFSLVYILGVKGSYISFVHCNLSTGLVSDHFKDVYSSLEKDDHYTGPEHQYFLDRSKFN